MNFDPAAVCARQHVERRHHAGAMKDAGLKIPTEQVWFCKQPTSVNDPCGAVELPKVSNMLDYEVELVAEARWVADSLVKGSTLTTKLAYIGWRQSLRSKFLGMKRTPTLVIPSAPTQVRPLDAP